MNSYFNILIKLLIFLIISILILMALFFANIINLNLDDFKNDDSFKNYKKSSEELTDEKIKKINDSLDKREERIKALKEVGKKLGG
jgi:5-bromo-4-chloroindolyl phosphate hydrolysis protein